MIIGKFYQGEIVVSYKEKECSQIDKKAPASRIKKIREDANMTQEQMCALLDKALRTYQKIENGDNNVSISVLQGLKENLGVSSDYILYGDKPDYATVWSSVQSCSEEDKMLIFIQLVRHFIQKKTPQIMAQQSSLAQNTAIQQMVVELLNAGAE